MSQKDFKEQSKTNWTTSFGEKPDTEHLKLGCLQRIADSFEKLNLNFQESNRRTTNLILANDRLERSVKYYKNKLIKERAGKKNGK